MGRHADISRKRGFRVPVGAISIALVLLCAVVLGIWWWTLKSATDPIGADPVDAYGLVVSSPSCTAGSLTTVTVSGTNPPVTATLNACGYRVGEQLPIQYLAGHPETVRLTGTSTAGSTSMAARLLPIGILTAGVIAVLATVSLLVERRRSRHQAGSAGRAAGHGRARSSDATAGVDGSPMPGDGEPGDQGPLDAAAAARVSTAADVAEPGAADGTASSVSSVFPESAYGTGYVVEGGMLFTHTRPEPPEPAGAPVELTGPAPDPDPDQPRPPAG
jgi:hypothetical protein